MKNIDPPTNHLSENDLESVSGGMDMTDPIDAGGSGSSGGLIDTVGVGVWAAAGPGGYLIYQGGVGMLTKAL
jgi:hypothetical protein